MPEEKQKSNLLPWRDPMTREIFQLILSNAGSQKKYGKDIRKAQLRIVYTLLYSVGVRINELRLCRLKDIEEAIEFSELKVTFYKTKRSHNYPLSAKAVENLKSLKKEFAFLGKTHKFVFLFGKKTTLNEKTIIKIVNEDLAATCELCGIKDNIKSHSFRVGFILRLLRVASVQNVSDIIGHQDVRSTMRYNRYRFSKKAIRDVLSQVEELTDFVKKEQIRSEKSILDLE